MPGGQRDGGRDVVNIEVYTLDESGASVELTRGHVEVPAAGMSAYYAMKRSSIPFSTTEMVSQSVCARDRQLAKLTHQPHAIPSPHFQGGKSVVTIIADVAQRFPKTAWILTHKSAVDGEEWPNVNLAETLCVGGDVLTWRLMKIGTQPKPRPRAQQADIGAPAAENDEAEL